MGKLSAETFIKNRYKLNDIILPSSVLILSANRVMHRNGDQDYPYRQSSNFYYLTGIKQEACVLVMISGGNRMNSETILFIPEGDKRTERWDGPKISISEASAISGIKEIRYSAALPELLQRVFRVAEHLYFGTTITNISKGYLSNEHEIRSSFAEQIADIEEKDLAPLMKKVRQQKEDLEIEMMCRAIDITGETFRKILLELKPGMKEYEVAAIMSYEFLKRASSGHAFDPIVASGENALTLHYCANQASCKEGDLLLIDFGADWEYYAADISRTIPVNGRYSERQKEVYNANLRVMNAAIGLMVPGKLMADFNKEVGSLWEEEHVNLGLYSLEDLRRQDLKQPLWSQYYWHGTSHSIGIDVHDPYISSEPLMEGMVMSCEPGIYLLEEGLGIRLENDILITSNSALNLSANIPIDPEEIEELMNG